MPPMCFWIQLNLPPQLPLLIHPICQYLGVTHCYSGRLILLVKLLEVPCITQKNGLARKGLLVVHDIALSSVLAVAIVFRTQMFGGSSYHY